MISAKKSRKTSKVSVATSSPVATQEAAMVDDYIKAIVTPVLLETQVKISEATRNALDVSEHRLSKKIEESAEKVKAEATKERLKIVKTFSELEKTVTAFDKTAKAFDTKVEEVSAEFEKIKPTIASLEATILTTVTEMLPLALPKLVDGGSEVLEGAVALPPVLPTDATYASGRVGKLVQRSLRSKKPLMLSGPSGSGKSYVVEQEARKDKQRYFVQSCAEGLKLGDFTARQGISDGKTAWTLGVLPLSMKHGCVLILDEIDSIQQELAQILLRALEYRRLIIPQTGEEIVAHPDWVCFATCNTLRDETGLYAGSRPSAALLNRFQYVACDYMSMAEEISIFRAKGASKELAERVAHWLKAARPLMDKRMISMAPSTRVGLAIVYECLGMDESGKVVNKPITFTEAIHQCFLDALQPKEYQHMKSHSLAN
jgi:hypothetical protein